MPIDVCGRDRGLHVQGTGAEGATAPEPLRQTDRRPMALWKATASSLDCSPKGKVAHDRNLGRRATQISQVP
jgi:hypothetical protein